MEDDPALKSDPSKSGGDDMVAPKIRFDGTVNFGHLLTAGTFLIVAFSAWATLQAQVSSLGQQVRDYPQIRDSVLSQETRVRALETLAASNNDTNKRVLETLSDVRADISGIKATVEYLKNQ